MSEKDFETKLKQAGLNPQKACRNIQNTILRGIALTNMNTRKEKVT